MPPITTWDIKYAGTGGALKRFDQEVCFGLRLLLGDSFSPKVQGNTVKEVFVPVGLNRHSFFVVLARRRLTPAQAAGKRRAKALRSAAADGQSFIEDETLKLPTA